MNYKIRVTQRDMYKVLDVISDYKRAKKGIVYVDSSFYDALLPMSKVKVNQALNALEDEGVIEKFESPYRSYLFCIRLTLHAYAYRKQNKKSAFRYWVPNILSVIAIIISILAYLK